MIPVQNDINETWTSWIKQGETMDIDTTALAFFNKYFNAVNQAQKNNDWAQANSVVDEIGAYQQKWGKNIVPPQTKVNIEVFYNHFEPFFHVMKVYGVLGIIFLILGFMNLFSNKKILRKLIFLYPHCHLGSIYGSRLWAWLEVVYFGTCPMDQWLRSHCIHLMDWCFGRAYSLPK